MRRIILVAAMAVAVVSSALGTGASSGPRHVSVAAAVDLSACAPPPDANHPFVLAVGSVKCQDVRDSADLLGPRIAVPFEYYVPADCAVSGVSCPVLYLLHGFGGDFTEMLGTPGTMTSAWIQAETKRPPAGFEADPWNYADPGTWSSDGVAPLDMILVAPLGQTLADGWGPPGGGMDSYWVDWNPRYALKGDQQRYATPAPRFASFVTQELPAFVDRYLPAIGGRSGQAIAGVSLGGYGSYDLGLQHPDDYAVMESVSGAMNFLFAPAPQPGMVTLPPGVQPPVSVTYERLPAATGAVSGLPLPSQIGTFTTALDAFGDPVADQAYFRGNMPTDLAMNGRAYGASGDQLLGIDGFVNDMVPEQAVTGDPAALQNDLSSEPFENIVFPMNLEMELAFVQQQVHNRFAVHQGNHTDVYRNAWFRGLEEYAYARLAHGPVSAPPVVPATFDYRSISTNFSIWGWQFVVDRQPVEFLTLRGVRCDGLTLQGTGTVQVTVPDACHTGLGGLATFSVDLGNSYPVDDPAALGALPFYGHVVTVHLTPLP
ncbi:MAG TPA: alpha/beta hydrolase-fold protein [Acidimicrobiales bacterium]|nr:alpha/beta hydrolase-fold protein [Acidimicrobiales bacterium]